MGLTIGLFLAVVAATGSVLAWRESLEPLLDGDLRQVSSCAAPQTPDALLAIARTAHPGARVAFIRITPGAAHPASVRFRDDDTVFLEACTGRVLGERARYGGLFGRVEQLHKLAYWTDGGWDKLIPATPTHNLITGTVAVLFVAVLVGVGLALWWPGRRRSWRAALAVDPRLRGRPLRLQLHMTVGVWISAIALTSATTGLVYAFQWPRAVLSAVAGAAPRPMSKPGEGRPDRGDKPLPLEAAWQQARLAMPDLVSAQIVLPQKPADPLRIRAIERGAPHSQAFSTLVLDASSGRRLDFEPYASLPGGTKAFYWARAIHTGAVGGVVGQALLTLGALGTLVSIYAGFSSYLRKLASRRREASARRSPDTSTAEAALTGSS